MRNESTPIVKAASTSGDANTYTLSVGIGISSDYPPEDGDIFRVKMHATNTGASTLNINSSGAKTIKYQNTDLFSGELISGRWYDFQCDGTYYQVVGGIQREGIVGEVRMFLSTTIPSNFLLLDGSSAYDLENDYPALYALLGNSNTLPDFRDRFVRAWGATRDPNTLQDEEFKEHVHSISVADDTHNHTTNSTGSHQHTLGVETSGSSTAIAYKTAGVSWSSTLCGSAGSHSHTVANDTHNHTASAGNAGGTETRPKNISVVFAICAK